MRPREWYEAGRPYRCKLDGGDPLLASRAKHGAQKAFCSEPPGGCQCSAQQTLSLPEPARTEWLKRCPGCAAQVRAAGGLSHIQGQGFAGAGMSGGNPIQVRATPAQIQPLGPTTSIDPRGSVGETNVSKLRFAPTNTGTSSGGSSTGQGGGWIDTGLQIGGHFQESGWGQSKCKGPYDYRGGRCVLKPPTWGGWANYPGGYAAYAQGLGPGVGGGMGGYQGGGAGLGLGGANPCPTGFEWDGMQCRQQGFQGWAEGILPGGETGTGVDVYGDAVMGAFGKPAIVPATVAMPTRRCPPGTVLGKDNLCYARGSITNQNRKWPKPPRPLLSAADMKTIRKAKSLAGRVKKAATVTGFSCRKR